MFQKSYVFCLLNKVVQHFSKLGELFCCSRWFLGRNLINKDKYFFKVFKNEYCVNDYRVPKSTLSIIVHNAYDFLNYIVHVLVRKVKIKKENKMFYEKQHITSFKFILKICSSFTEGQRFPISEVIFFQVFVSGSSSLLSSSLSLFLRVLNWRTSQ